MDEAKAEELGMKPIQSELDAIAAMKDYPDVIRTVAALQRVGVQGLFGAFVNPDAKKADQNIVYLNQGGLGMPDESYYHDKKYDPLRKAYVAHVERMFTLAKVHDPAKASRVDLYDGSRHRGRALGQRQIARRRQDLQQDVARSIE